MHKSLLYSLLLIPLLSIAITQNGPVGNPSVGMLDAKFTVSAIAKISGTRDITLNNINPLDTKTLPTETVEGICLYSSTGRVSVTATTDSTVDHASQSATLINEHNQTTSFRLQMGNLDLFAGNPPNFTASIASDSCADQAGVYSLTVTLTEVPKWAGTYQAEVTLKVDPI